MNLQPTRSTPIRANSNRPSTVLLMLVCLFSANSVVLAQAPNQWAPARRSTLNGSSSPATTLRPGPLQMSSIAPIGSIAESGRLPNDAGQVWREYDIRSFTSRRRDQEKPEQVIVDWILRETGTDTWFGEPLGVLSVNRDVVRVYHTPRVQDLVEKVVDRFLQTRSEAHEVAVRLVTIDNPNWRVKAASMLTPVPTQTPGIDAWVISRENATLLVHELSKRTDYMEHNSPNLTIYSGQTHELNSTRPRVFSKGAPTTGATGFANMSELGQVDEGFSLEINPLISHNRRTMDAVIKCSVNQVEELSPLWVDGVDQYGMRKRTQIQIPQISSWQLNERFRWPVDQVLLISRGLVATPSPTAANGSVRKMLGGKAPRSNALLFLESRQEIRSAATQTGRMANRTNAANYRGRY